MDVYDNKIKRTDNLVSLLLVSLLWSSYMLLCKKKC